MRSRTSNERAWEFFPAGVGKAGVVHYGVFEKEGENLKQLLTFDEIGKLLVEDVDFRGAMSKAVSTWPWEDEENPKGVLFECRPFVPSQAAGTPFDFVIISEPGLDGVTQDNSSFGEHFNASKKDEITLKFSNLGKDAELIVPNLISEEENVYSHIKSFIINGKRDQVDDFWIRMGQEINQRVRRASKEPVWISTNGLGVSFVHLRFDTKPKYYKFEEYKETPEVFT